MHPAQIPVALAIAWGLNWPAVKIMLSVLTPFNPQGRGDFRRHPALPARGS